MTYYIEDYQYEKHDLLVEQGDKNQHTGVWIDQPELVFYEDNVVKLGYSISIVRGDTAIITFYNDVIMSAKDSHKLSAEELSIFLLLLMSETIIESTEYLKQNHRDDMLIDVPTATPESVVEFVTTQMNALN